MIASTTIGCYLALAGLWAGAMQHDPFTGPVEVLRYSFESEDELDLLPGQWQPRGWTRRKGPQFPAYVSTGIDRQRGFQSNRSLRFDLNGGQAVNYSPAVPIDALHSYVFQGYIRTQLLKNDAALLSVSFLNHKRQRVQRFLSQAVTGTHRGWVRVRIGPVAPREDARFVVIGCHLTHGKMMDIRGSVWFDELFLGKLPQLSLASSFETHFKQRYAPIEITASASGLDLERLAGVWADDESEAAATLDGGSIPDALRQEMASIGTELADEADVKPESNGRWLVSDGGRNFLIVQETERSLAVYDTRSPYTLRMRILDVDDRVVDETTFALEATPPERHGGMAAAAPRRDPKRWRLDAKEYGYYRVQSALERDGAVILEKNTSFVVIEFTDQIERGRFGWSIETGVRRMPPRELADVAAQAGINWLKHPVWTSASAENRQQAVQVAEMFDRLAHRGVTPIGLLSDPPPAIRKMFARDWSGVSEIFSLSRDSWAPWLEPVIARYSSNVQHWQLGGEDDVSFSGVGSLPQTVLNVKREFDRIGRNTQIGIRWNWNTPLPPRAEMPPTFLSFDDMYPDPPEDEDEPPRPMTGPELIERLERVPNSGFPRWVLLKPSGRGLSLEERGSDLVKRMVAARIGGANAIFATNVFDPQDGLLDPGGSPTALFLPWRTAALALKGAEYLGSFNLPGGSTNFAFAREDEVVLFLWNDEGEATEEIYLGETSRVVATDLWGRPRNTPFDKAGGRQQIRVTAVPQIIRGCSRPVAEWRLAAQFQDGRLPSATGKHPNAIVGRNPFPQGVSGRATINVPPEWEIEPSSWEFSLGPGEEFSLPMVLTIPANTSLGNAVLTIDFDIDADTLHTFRVLRPVEIGLGDVFMHVIDRRLEDGRVEIEQIIVNRTSPQEVLNFNCSLFSRNNRRQKKRVTRLGNGKSQKKYYIPNAAALRGSDLWLRAEQVNGRRVLNYRWKLGRYWDLPEEELQEMLKQLQQEWDKPMREAD